ncbi:hypothetical protein B0H14DRAFT_3652718 [Mycena olivaceomarginata]|nr:hypothetical protein B0H14DRAFT_3652718 [Mycena olivaceomarginata]
MPACRCMARTRDTGAWVWRWTMEGAFSPRNSVLKPIYTLPAFFLACASIASLTAGAISLNVRDPRVDRRISSLYGSKWGFINGLLPLLHAANETRKWLRGARSSMGKLASYPRRHGFSTRPGLAFTHAFPGSVDTPILRASPSLGARSAHYVACSAYASALLRLPRDGSLEAKKFRTLETMNELGILGMKDSWIGVSGLDSYNAWRVSSPSHGTMTGLRSSPFTSPAATSWRSSKLAALVEAYAIRTTVLECGCRFGVGQLPDVAAEMSLLRGRKRAGFGIQFRFLSGQAFKNPYREQALLMAHYLSIGLAYEFYLSRRASSLQPLSLGTETVAPPGAATTDAGPAGAADPAAA